MKNTQILPFIIFAFWLFLQPVFSQDFLVTKEWIGIEDGLSDANINVVYQDHQKFIWTATPNLINKYDSERFEYFRLDTISGVNEILINQINEDQNGILWFSETYLNPYSYTEGTEFREIIILDPATKQLQSFSSFFLDAPFYKEEISAIHQDEDRNLWFGLKRGQVWKYDGSFSKVYKNYSKTAIYSISTTDDGGFYVGGLGFVLKLDPNGLIQDSIKMEGAIIKHWCDKENRIWIKGVRLEENKLRRDKPILFYKNKEGELVSFFDLLPNEYQWLKWEILTVELATDGNLWFSSSEGIIIFDQTGKLILDLRPFFGQKEESQWIKVGLLTDDLAWLISNQSASRGLISVSVRRNHFHKLLHNGTPLYSTRGITSLENGNLLVLSYRGIYELALDSLFNEEVIGPIFIPRFFGFGIDRDKQNIYLGIHGKDLHVFDSNGRSSYKVENVDSNNDKTSIGDFLIPFIDKNKKLWIGTDRGLLYLDSSRMLIRSNPHQSAFPAISEAKVYHFYENAQGIWVSTSRGLFLMDRGGRIIAHHTHLPSAKLTHLYEDKDQVFWIGTANDGLIYWDRSRDSIRQFTRLDGLSDLSVHAILEDSFGFLWISTNNGLMRYNKNKDLFEGYFEKDGLAQNEFNQCSYFQDSDGQLFFGGINGITTFHPRDFLSENFVEDKIPKLTGIEAFDNETGSFEDYYLEYLSNNRLEFNSNLKAFKVDFSFPDYSHSLQSRYAYRIVGLEHEWTEAKESIIRISQLPYGDYRLEIKAMQRSGRWSKPLMIPLDNPKPYFLQYWFLTLVILLAILIVISWIRYRTYRLRRQADELSVQVIQRTQTIESQKKELEQANEFKDKLFSLIAHDLQTPVEGLGNMSKRLNFLIEQERYDDLRKLGAVISVSSGNISKLISNLLNWTLIQRKQFYVNPKSLLLDAVVSETIELYQSMIKYKEINFVQSLTPQLRVFVDEQILNTILRNIIDNAVKYSPKKGTIHLRTALQENYIQLILENSGTSITNEIIQTLQDDYSVKDKVLPGMGLRLCKKMADLCNGQFSIVAITPNKTQVKVKLPSASMPKSPKEHTPKLTYE